MKDNKKIVKETEKTEETGTKLTDEELSQVSGGASYEGATGT